MSVGYIYVLRQPHVGTERAAEQALVSDQTSTLYCRVQCEINSFLLVADYSGC